jgi:bifunctional DNase/RNase
VVENTYYASLLLRRGSETLTVDSRPSDSVALALRASAPIFVADSLLDHMPIEIQQDSDDEHEWASSGEDVIPRGDPGATGGTSDPAELREYLRGLDPEDFGRFQP